MASAVNTMSISCDYTSKLIRKNDILHLINSPLTGHLQQTLKETREDFGQAVMINEHEIGAVERLERVAYPIKAYHN